ncbi:hypothetical protein [Salipaludibacillus aurantiacus]|uniref:Uncharacterized protein n=1 Tax=Salipaludibacillus aurantiacus TaxID=1601833 RepID=A0A1H9TE35_9BACI|nr:hypothetical protein [Salipaludibacillus aurantiacus]SER95089.1 hypothetical protein SAMN05518684_105265 [Salipaludibacillus aurantiacus]
MVNRGKEKFHKSRVLLCPVYELTGQNFPEIKKPHGIIAPYG